MEPESATLLTGIRSMRASGLITNGKEPAPATMRTVRDMKVSGLLTSGKGPALTTIRAVRDMKVSGLPARRREPVPCIIKTELRKPAHGKPETLWRNRKASMV